MLTTCRQGLNNYEPITISFGAGWVTEICIKQSAASTQSELKPLTQTFIKSLLYRLIPVIEIGDKPV